MRWSRLRIQAGGADGVLRKGHPENGAALCKERLDAALREHTNNNALRRSTEALGCQGQRSSPQRALRVLLQRSGPPDD